MKIGWDKDVGVKLTFTIKKRDGSAFDLTGKTVKLYVRTAAGSPFTLNLDDAANGIASLTIPASTFSADQYEAQIQVSGGGKTYHSKKLALEVEEALT